MSLVLLEKFLLPYCNFNVCLCLLVGPLVEIKFGLHVSLKSQERIHFTIYFIS